jgi:seryl-tRNA synthetase
MISALRLERTVRDEIVKLLLEPTHLREGYEDAAEQQATAIARRQAHMEELKRSRIKVEQKAQNLMAAYIDPDIGMAKDSYVAQKAKLSDELKAIDQSIAQVQQELEQIPTPMELATLEEFAAKVRKHLGGKREPSKETKLKILDLLNVMVWISPTGEIEISGYFEPRSTRLLSQTC